MMDAVKKGGDRQELHERIRTHSMDAAYRIKQGDGVNDLLERIAADPAFGMTLAELETALDPSRYVGRAPEQTEEFLKNEVQPILDASADELGLTADITV